MGRPPIVSRPQEVLTEEDQKFELSDLYSPFGKWSPEDKIAAASAMMICGSSPKAASHLKRHYGLEIAESTIRWWAAEASWWPDLMKVLRKEKDEELDAMQTDMIHKSAEELQDRLDQGDEVVTKDGDVVRKAVGARDLAIIHGTLYDKRALKRGDPTSKVERSDSEALAQLAEQFSNFAKKMEESGNLAKPINVNKE